MKRLKQSAWRVQKKLNGIWPTLRGALIFVALTLPCTATAQAVLSPLPSDALIDENGVNLAAGQFHHVSSDVSIGDLTNGGLEYKRYYSSQSMKNNFEVVKYSIPVLGGYTYAGWGVGGASYSFTYAGTAPIDPTGASVTYDAVTKTRTFTGADGTVYIEVENGGQSVPYAPTARLTEIRKPNGEVITLHYSQGTFLVPRPGGGNMVGRTYRLRSVTNNYGYHLKFEYQPSGGYADDWVVWSHVVKVTAINMAVDYCDPAAGSCTNLTQTWPTVTYSPITQTNRTFVKTDAVGAQTGYASATAFHNIRFPLTPVGSFDISISRISYDLYRTNDVNRYVDVVSQVVTPAGTWSYGYAEVGATRVVTVTDPQAAQRVYVSDVNTGRMLSYKNEINQTTSYAYDTYGRLTRVTQPEGNYEEYTYDARGNITQKTLVAKSGSGLSNIVSTASYSATCTNRKVCNKPNSVTDARGGVTNYTYDPTHGGLLSAKSPAPTFGAVRPESRTSYTALYAWYKNSSGTIVQAPSAIYKPTGTSACITLASCAGGADEVKTTVTYGSAGTAKDLAPTSTSSGSGNGVLTATVANSRDVIGNLIAVDGPLAGTGDTTHYRYDAVRRQVGQISPDRDGAGPLNRRAIRTTYDVEDNVTSVEAGTVAGLTDPDWAAFSPLTQTTADYDALRRKAKDRLVVGGVTQWVKQYSYDVRSRLECTAVRMNPAVFGSLPSSACSLGATGTDGPDRIVRNTYNAANQLTQVASAYGTALQQNTITSTYSADGLQATVTDAEGNKTTFEHDGFDRPKKTRYPSPTMAGTSSTTDYEELSYDAASNVTQLRRRDTQTVAYAYDALNRKTTDIDGVTYTYDNLNRRVTAVRSADTLTTLWDALGRMVSETGALGTMGYQYDLAGRRTRLTWPDGFYVAYDYDLTNGLTVVRENGAVSGPGVLATLAYDDLGRRVSLTRGNGVATAYAYDDAQNLETLEHDLAGTAADQAWTFGRNVAGQVRSRAGTNGSYDHPAPGAVSHGYVANGLNQYTTAGLASPTYDGRGNLTADGVKTYGYDVANRLMSATGGVTLSYDPAGRLSRVVGSATTRFGYDGVSVIGEHDGSGALLRRYVHGPGADEPLVWYEGAGTSDRRWLATDQQGSVVSVSDGTGASLGINTYDEYGAPAGSNLGRFQYTGQMWIPDVGVYHYKARAYHAALGRFLQTDPIGYSAGMNLYEYVGGDPVGKHDPSGLARVCVSLTGSRMRSCVDVDGDGDGLTNDRDLTKSQIATLARDFRNFIVKNPGRDLAGLGKTVEGGASHADKAMVRATSQFVGAAARQEGGRILAQWERIGGIITAPDRSFGTGHAALSDTNWIWLLGPANPYYRSPSNLARWMFHETGHVGQDRGIVGMMQNLFIHQSIDARARGLLGAYGLDGGGCIAANNFSGCGQ